MNELLNAECLFLIPTINQLLTDRRINRSNQSTIDYWSINTACSFFVDWINLNWLIRLIVDWLIDFLVAWLLWMNDRSIVRLIVWQFNCLLLMSLTINWQKPIELNWIELICSNELIDELFHQFVQWLNRDYWLFNWFDRMIWFASWIWSIDWLLELLELFDATRSLVVCCVLNQLPRMLLVLLALTNDFNRSISHPSSCLAATKNDWIHCSQPFHWIFAVELFHSRCRCNNLALFLAIKWLNRMNWIKMNWLFVRRIKHFTSTTNQNKQSEPKGAKV